MERILAALDGSPESEQILDEVARVGTRDTVIHLVHVLENPHHEVPQAGARLEDVAEDYLRKAATRIRGRKARIHLLHGEPQEEIPRAAENLKADLIALTTHARKGLANILMGSVAEVVVRNSSVPVLLTRPGLPRPRRPLERILAPIDGTETSRRIVGTIRSLAANNGAEVVLLQVVAPLIIGDPVTGFTPLGVPEPLPDPAPALEDVARQLTKDGVLARALVTHGDPAEQILEQARTLNADLIAMATAGRKGLSRFMIGSVAENVVRHMDRAVLLHRISAKAEAPAQARGSHAQEAD